MQGFINKEYYVYCSSRAEVKAFYGLCKKHCLHFTTRWPAEQEVADYVDNATFVYDFDIAKPGDGVSFWTCLPNGDGNRPMICFGEVNASHIDVTDILNLL